MFRDPWEPLIESSDSPIYGVLWNRTSTSPTLSRIDENGDSISPTTLSFNNHPLWGNIRRCTLDASGNASYGTNAKGDGLTLTSDYCMVEIPGCYAGSFREGDYQGLLLGTVPFKSKYVTSVWHPAFYRRDRTGVKSRKLYLGAYEASDNGGKLTSKSGVAPLTSRTIAQFESAAKLIGSCWGIQSFWTQALLQSLFYIEYASFNSQSALAPGRTNSSNSSALATGQGNSLMGTNGTGGGTNQQAVCYRGIENPWGNIWKFIIGFNSIDTAYNVMKRDGTGALANIMTAGNYEQTSGVTPLKGTHGYVSDLVFSDPLKLAFVPSALSGSETTYLTDYFNCHSAGTTGILIAGGAWNNAGGAGVGCLYANYAASSVHSSFGARLEAIF